MQTDPNDHVATLKQTFALFTRTENLVPLLVDALVVLTLGTCTLGIMLPPLMLGYTAMCLRILRGERVSVGESFQGMERFSAAMMLGLLLLAATLVGSLAAGVGALVAGFCLSYVFCVQYDRPDLGAVDVAKESFRLVRDHLVETAVLWAIGAGLGALLAATLVGSVAVFAFSTLLSALLYTRFLGRAPVPQS
jgi:hypothetical protein